MVDGRGVPRKSSPGSHCMANRHRFGAAAACTQGGKNSVAIGPDPNTVPPPGDPSRKRPAAGYLRSATELEGESLREQLEAIVRYARNHGMQLIRVYCDECGSGLRIDGRSGLGQMLRDIESGACGFDAILLLEPEPLGPLPCSRRSRLP